MSGEYKIMPDVGGQSHYYDLPKLITAPSDRELAADLRKRLEEQLSVVLEIMNEANRAGLQTWWQLGRDQMGRNRLLELVIYRPL